MIWICLLAFNFMAAQNNDFSLSGKTSNIEDGTYLFIRDMVNGGDIDSTSVQNNTFQFTTKLPEPVLFVMLFTKDRSNFKELWLENSEMTFDASQSDFTDAEVKGSKNQLLAIELKKIYVDINEISKDTLEARKKRFVQAHPDALVSAYAMYGNRNLEIHELRDLFAKLTPEVQNSSLGKKIRKNLDKDIPQIGDTYADFSVPNTENKSKRISELTGNLTLLQFWGSGCGFSRSMNATLSQVYREYKPKGFEIISISNDIVKENWLTAIEEDHLAWPQLSNLKGWEGEVFQAYGINGTPSNFLIDKEGKIIARNIDETKIAQIIKQNLKK